MGTTGANDPEAAMRVVQMYKTQQELKVAQARLVEVETENSQLRLEVAPPGDGKKDAKVQGQVEGQAAVDLLNLKEEVQQLKTRLRKYEDVDGGQVRPTEKNGSVLGQKAASPPPPQTSSEKPKGPPAKAKGAESSPTAKRRVVNLRQGLLQKRRLLD